MSDELPARPLPGASTARRTLPSVTGLRAIAALLVFACHARALYIFGDNAIERWYDRIFDNIGIGTMAVTAFFVLSGFVLTWSTKPGVPAGQFYRRRFFKMFPNHVVVFTAALLVLLLAGRAVAPVPALANLFLVHTWVPDFTLSLAFGAVNGPTWSLSDEWLLCLLFPVLFVLVRRIKPKHLWGWAIGIAVVAVLLPLISQTFLPALPRHPYLPEMSTADMWFLYFGPPSWMVSFTIGMIFARIVRTNRWVGFHVVPTMFLVAAALGVALFLPAAYRMTALYPLPVAMLFSSVAESDLSGRTTWLGSKPMVWFGNISYAFFLIHLTALYTVYELFTGGQVGSPNPMNGGQLGWGPIGGLAFLLGVMALVVTLSWLLHEYVELPMARRWSRPMPDPRTAPAAA